MFRFRSVLALLPIRVLAGWLVASMIGWLGVGLVGVAIERAVFAAPLTPGLVIATIGGAEGTALLLALAIFALLMAVASAEAAAMGSPARRRPGAWMPPVSFDGQLGRSASAARWPSSSVLH